MIVVNVYHEVIKNTYQYMYMYMYTTNLENK